MLYVKDNFCVIDKYLKNDEIFRYVCLKYNMTSKSVKFFFIFWTCRLRPIVNRNVYEFFECRCLFLFFNFKKGWFLGKSDSGKQVPSSCCYGNQTVQIFSYILSQVYTSNFNLYNCTS